MRIVLCVVLLLLSPVLARAAYQNPVIIANEQQANGIIKLTLQFTGNAGEPVVTREYIVNPSTTGVLVRNWVSVTIAELNTLRTAANLAALQPGQTVTALDPVALPPSPRAVWRSKVDMYAKLEGRGFAGALATAVTALKTDIEATYQAGYLDAN